MYDAAISQVFMLCSHTAMGYDGQPSATAAVNGGTEDDQGIIAVRVRVYWCKCVYCILDFFFGLTAFCRCLCS